MLEKFSEIEVFVFDVDGVLTDGTLLLLPGGEMARSMSIKDGFSLQLAVRQGFKIVIISGGQSTLVKARLEKLGISNIFMGVPDKKELLQNILEHANISPSKTLYMGDDIPDLEAMEYVGLPCCPADACEEIKAVSLYVSPLPGGAGCVREVMEKVMRIQGKWRIDESIVSL